LCFFCGQNGVIDRLFGVVATAEVKRQHFGDFVSPPCIQLFERMPQRAVIGAAIAIEQTPIGRFLGQRMTKNIRDSLGRDALGR
jgi:hypothetical protein